MSSRKEIMDQVKQLLPKNCYLKPYQDQLFYVIKPTFLGRIIKIFNKMILMVNFKSEQVWFYDQKNLSLAKEIAKQINYDLPSKNWSGN